MHLEDGIIIFQINKDKVCKILLLKNLNFNNLHNKQNPISNLDLEILEILDFKFSRRTPTSGVYLRPPEAAQITIWAAVRPIPVTVSVGR